MSEGTSVDATGKCYHPFTPDVPDHVSILSDYYLISRSLEPDCFVMSTAWADDEDAPPGFEGEKKAADDAPPGFEGEADKLAAELKSSAKVELDADEPDLTLRLAEGLREGIQDAQITTQSETLYSSAARFEDLPLSAEILQGLYVEMKFEKPSKIQAITLPMVGQIALGDSAMHGRLPCHAGRRHRL